MATDLRVIIFQALRSDPFIAETVGDRIVQRGSWDAEDGTVEPIEVPYLVYSMSDEAQHGPSAMRATRRYLMVWAHDEPGDYGLYVDPLLDRVKEVLVDLPQQGKFMDCRFLLKSPDLWDDMLKHIVRYDRFYATLAE
jgi:hypothetical protein